MLFVYVRYIVELDLTKLVKRVYPSFHGNKGLDIVHVALGWDTDAYSQVIPPFLLFFPAGTQ